MCVMANKLSLFFLQSCIYSKKYVSEKFIDAVSTHVLGIHDKNKISSLKWYKFKNI